MTVLLSTTNDVAPRRPALDLTIAVGADGESHLSSRHVSFPWSLGRGYRSAPGTPVLLIPQAAGAGLLAGDCVQQKICVADEAALHLASAGAMLVYGTEGGSPAASHWHVDVRAGARARLISEPYVLFDNANLDLRQSISVHPDATLVMCDGIVLARSGTVCEWTAETVARTDQSEMLFVDRQRADRQALGHHSALGDGWTAFGTVLYFGRHVLEATQRLQDAASSFSEHAWIGIAPMRTKRGCMARLAARDGQVLRAALHGLANALSDV